MSRKLMKLLERETGMHPVGPHRESHRLKLEAAHREAAEAEKRRLDEQDLRRYGYIRHWR